jgi:hypothetical protein
MIIVAGSFWKTPGSGARRTRLGTAAGRIPFRADDQFEMRMPGPMTPAKSSACGRARVFVTQ